MHKGAGSRGKSAGPHQWARAKLREKDRSLVQMKRDRQKTITRNKGKSEASMEPLLHRTRLEGIKRTEEESRRKSGYREKTGLGDRSEDG